MYPIEINKFNKKINKARLHKSSKEDLFNIVEMFFETDYTNISKERKLKVEEDFISECFRIKTINKPDINSDINEVEEIISQIENSLFTILDKSVEEGFLEKIAGKLGPVKLTLIKK